MDTCIQILDTARACGPGARLLYPLIQYRLAYPIGEYRGAREVFVRTLKDRNRAN